MISSTEEVHPSLVIVTVHGDSHAYVIALELQARGVVCAVIEVDSVSCDGGVAFRVHPERQSAVIKDHFGRWVVLAGTRVVWWRRVSRTQRLAESFDDRSEALIHADSHAAATGVFLATPHLRYVSTPSSTYKAENKLLQLSVARALGLSVPETLVSNDFGSVVAFLQAIGGEGIVKPARGIASVIDTRRVTPLDLDEKDVRSVPLIYQKLIRGNRHLRVNVFGEDMIAAQITTDHLDWRRVLPTEIVETQLDPALEAKCRALCLALGLRMGVIDIKIDECGIPTFLEINPQGQFLFLEPMINVDIKGRFAQFLVDEMKS